jgi:serine phosphatase RsbU (regulator of sigma subunit)
VLVGADGEPKLLGRPGTLLGVLDQIKVSEVEAELGPGETLLLYTDGIPEAGPSGAQLGEQGLLEATRAPGLSLEDLLEHIESTALTHAGGSLRDDMALLGVRLSDP